MQLTESGTWAPTYDEFTAAMDAVHTGVATELWQCTMCLPLPARMQVLFGRVTVRESGAPLRGEVSRVVCGLADPTEVITLTCGHVIA